MILPKPNASTQGHYKSNMLKELSNDLRNMHPCFERTSSYITIPPLILNIKPTVNNWTPNWASFNKNQWFSNECLVLLIKIPISQPPCFLYLDATSGLSKTKSGLKCSTRDMVMSEILYVKTFKMYESLTAKSKIIFKINFIETLLSNRRNHSQVVKYNEFEILPHKPESWNIWN